MRLNVIDQTGRLTVIDGDEFCVTPNNNLVVKTGNTNVALWHHDTWVSVRQVDQSD